MKVDRETRAWARQRARRSKYLYGNAYASVRTSKTSQRCLVTIPRCILRKNKFPRARYPNDVIRRRYFLLSLSLSLSLLIFFLLLFFPSSLAVRRGEFENRWGAYGAEKLEVPQRGGNTSCVSRANTRQCVAGGREREREKSRRKRRKRRRRLKQTWSHTFFIPAESQSWRLFAVRGSRLTLLDKGGDPYLWSKENIFSRNGSREAIFERLSKKIYKWIFYEKLFTTFFLKLFHIHHYFIYFRE